MEEVEAASKKARQDEDIHSEHVQVNNNRLVLSVSVLLRYFS